MLGGFMLFLTVVLPFAAAPVVYWIGRTNKVKRSKFACIISFVDLAMILLTLPVFGIGTTFCWNGFCGVGLKLELDGFRWLYGSIASLMWAMTNLFSLEYFGHYRNRNRYYFFNMLTYGATMGVFLSSDLMTTFVFFEIMSFTSYVLVIHDENEKAQKAAKVYLAIAVLGGMVMLMGLFMLFAYGGTLHISELNSAVQNLPNSLRYTIGALILFGFGAKAGMFPLHIWLPAAHPVAPAPASALLSGILTKAGIFGILVLCSTMFLHDKQWGLAVLLLGVITMFVGAVLGVLSIDLKRTLACSSMSQIGFILVGVAMQCILAEHNALAVWGTTLHMVNHSLIKLVLFMCAGVVYMNLHTLNLNDIRGYGKDKPFLQFTFAMGALGIMGIPLWNGYVSKTLIHESLLEYIAELPMGAEYAFIKTSEVLFTVTGGLTIAYMLKLFIAIFVENPIKPYVIEKSSYISIQSKLAIGIPALFLPIMGIFPHQTMEKMAELAQAFMHGHTPEHSVHYFAFVNLKGAVASIAIGLLVYFGVVRTILMKQQNSTKVYVDRLPEKLNLETIIYRPLINVLIFVGTFLARMIHSLSEGVLPKLLSREIKLRTVVPPTDTYFGTYEVTKVKEEPVSHSHLSYSFLSFGIGVIVVLSFIWLS